MAGAAAQTDFSDDVDRPLRAPAIERRRVDGVLLLDKPRGLSSNAALQRTKRLFRAAKGGHTGTLDPLATGLLPICFGEATKFANLLLDADKAYLATLRLGTATTTGDAEGEVVRERPVTASQSEVENVLRRFVGRIAQIPPRHSALKRDGRKLYEYARRGIEIERFPREVEIVEISLLGWRPPEADISVRCSKGTYVRALAEDIGEALGCGAHISALSRTAVGALTLADAVSLDALEARTEAERDAVLLPIDALMDPLERVELAVTDARRLGCGQALACDRGNGAVRVYAANAFAGVAEIRDGVMRARRMLAQEAPPPRRDRPLTQLNPKRFSR
jgi:tRNA pseudouridine55 synthase